MKACKYDMITPCSDCGHCTNDKCNTKCERRRETGEPKKNKETNKMNTDRIKEIQQATAYPDSTSVASALKQVWNECAQESKEYIKELEARVKFLEGRVQRLAEHPDKMLSAVLKERDPDYYAACCASVSVLTTDEYERWLREVRVKGYKDVRDALEHQGVGKES